MQGGQDSPGSSYIEDNEGYLGFPRNARQQEGWGYQKLESMGELGLATLEGPGIATNGSSQQLV